MKIRVLISGLLCFACCFTTQAQSTDIEETLMSNQENPSIDKPDYRQNHFRFVYIDHEEQTPVAILHQRLKKLYDDAIESGSFLIIYLADEDNPIISFTNLNNPAVSYQRCNEEAFSNLLTQMYVTTHEVRAYSDLDTIQWLLDSDGVFPLFVEENGQTKLNFKSVCLDFYVGPRFWDLRCNEDLLVQLFVMLRLDQRLNTPPFPPTKLSFNVLIPRGVNIRYPDNLPFGRKNLGGINEKVEIKEY